MNGLEEMEDATLPLPQGVLEIGGHTDVPHSDADSHPYIYRAAQMSEAAEVAELLNIFSRATRGLDISSASFVRAEWECPGFDMEQSTRVVTDLQGKLVGYADLWDIAEPPVKPFVLAQVHPDYEGQGIGTRLMNWAEERARQSMHRVPAEARMTLCAAAYSTHQPSLELLTHLGMEPNRVSLEMGMDLDTPPAEPVWPQGISIHTYNEAFDPRLVFDARDAAFQDHRGYLAGDEDNRFQHWLHLYTHDPDYDPSLWFLAIADETIVGVVMSKHLLSEDPGRAWIDNLGVRPEWRNRGLGLALLLHTLGEFHRRGYERAALSVDGSSLTNATRLYTRAGMKTLAEYTILEKIIKPGVEITRH